MTRRAQQVHARKHNDVHPRAALWRQYRRGIMTSDFVETGMTFSKDGAAYCPIERKRRGAGALAAAMAVMLIGAGVLGYSLLGAPGEETVAAAPQASKEAPAPETAPQAPPRAATLTVEEALAEARAARAGVAVAEANGAETGETAQTTTEKTAAEDDDVFKPRLKPARAAAPEPAHATAHPLRMGERRLASDEDRPTPLFFASDIPGDIPARPPAPVALAADLERQFGEMRIRIARGETFVDALRRAGIGAEDRNEAAYAFGKHYNLRRLLPGQEFALTVGWPNQTLFQLAAEGPASEARLLGLQFRVDPENRIVMRRDAAGALTAEKSSVPLTTRTMAVSGVINGSLYVSAKAVGAPDAVIADLADAFSYDVDFQREIFGGDEFEVIFEVKYDDQGALVSTGDIIYARLNWRGKREEKGYYRFSSREDGDRSDFYDAAGQSARRLLMRTPIDGARLSSGFGTRRHPILGYRRAHKGVDFAAPRGTPIKPAGDGVVERADWYGSFGNYIRIRHANGYKTAYAHLKGFRRGIRKGKRVRQGDIIGYVGTTGRSTGPHLHYEVHFNGKAVNPQRLKIAATGKKLTGADLERFKETRDRIDAMRAPEPQTPPLYADDGEATQSTL